MTGFVPLPVRRHVPVPMYLLTNGDEDPALLVAATPSRSPATGVSFTLDRRRFCAEVSDDTSNYRAEAVLGARL